MDPLFSLLRLFPFNPIAALLLAALFLFGVKHCRHGRRTLLLTALLWAGYAVWESAMLGWRSTSGDAAIRVDLVVLIPLLLGISLFGVRLCLRRREADP